jgi:hypothetical protein
MGKASDSRDIRKGFLGKIRFKLCAVDSNFLNSIYAL